MAVIEPLDTTVSIVDAQGRPNWAFTEWLRKTVEDLVANALGAAEAAATAQAAAETAQTAADSAQATAEAVQAVVDDLVIPPTGSRTVTSSESIVNTDSTILADATAAPITLTLPPASGGMLAPLGPFTVKKIDVSANAVTVAADGSDTINGSPSATLTTQYETKTFTCNNVDAWFA